MSEQQDQQAKAQMHDALIIGAGPAGVSCAVWLARLGFAPVLIEAHHRIGGLCLGHAYHDNWNASLPGRTGTEVARQLAVSVAQANVPVFLNEAVSAVKRQTDPDTDADAQFIVTAHSGKQWRAHHVVLASGVRARRLPQLGDLSKEAQNGIEPLPGILIGPGAHVAAQNFQDKRVAVLGGGDNAFENALYALDHGAACVTIHARSVRAQQQFVRRFLAKSAATPAAAQMQGAATRVNPVQRQVNGKHYDLILVCYGWEPCAAFADALALSRDGRGFIATDWATAQTSVAGVYAIGEVAQRQHPCVVTALADGVTAAKAIQARLER